MNVFDVIELYKNMLAMARLRLCVFYHNLKYIKRVFLALRRLGSVFCCNQIFSKSPPLWARGWRATEQDTYEPNPSSHTVDNECLSVLGGIAAELDSTQGPGLRFKEAAQLLAPQTRDALIFFLPYEITEFLEYWEHAPCSRHCLSLTQGLVPFCFPQTLLKPSLSL